jgi:hypothetical protein
MIVTGCEGCCFLKRNDKGRGCALGQMCVAKDERVFAPGYCRTCRSDAWASKQNEKNITKLLEKVIEENTLKMDLLVFFDEAIHSLKDLQRTFNNDWHVKYTKNIIIADVTGFGKRQNLALQYLKSEKHSIPIIIDSSVSNEPFTQWESTIRRLSLKITAPFFMAIPAGSILRNISVLAKTIKYTPSRVIQWSLPIKIGNTIIVPNDSCYGLFITKPYRVLIKSPESKSFSQQLAIEEIETKMKLSWLCPECGLIQ